MDINIPENEEKGNPSTRHGGNPYIKALFWPVAILLAGSLVFGIGKLHTLETMRQPVTIEYDTTATSTITTTTPPRGLGTPPFQGGEASSTPIIASTTPAKTGNYVAARGGTVYYLPSCAAAKRISDKNKIRFDTKAEAEKFGYKPAKNCPGL